MAVLTENEIRAVAKGWMERVSSDRELVPLTKAQVLAAFTAVDQWISDNAASYNSALPAAARNNLTARQKRKLFLLVALARMEVD